METCSIFGIKYAVCAMAEAVPAVCESLKELKGRYICFSNVHTTVTAIEHRKYLDILNGSAYTFPDGVPIAKRLRRSGASRAERIAGPDFMEEALKQTSTGSISHYFYGTSEETLKKLEAVLRHKYPDMKIAGFYAPPFRDLSKEEDDELVLRINEAKPDIIWVGIGAPRQETFMADHAGRFDGVMLGVGAAFDFQAKTAKRAPLIMQKLSLEWLHRVISDPRRLLKRYLVTNTKYIWYCITTDCRKRRN